MEVSGQLHGPAALHPTERTPGTHWIGGWAGTRAGLEAEAKKDIFSPCGKLNPVVQPVASRYTD